MRQTESPKVTCVGCHLLPAYFNSARPKPKKINKKIQWQVTTARLVTPLAAVTTADNDRFRLLVCCAPWQGPFVER